jgi:hypothetical protein
MTSNTGSEAASRATAPRLLANTQSAWPQTTPSAVKAPPRPPPSRLVRTVSAVSGPGVMITSAEMPRKASSGPVIARPRG